MKRIFFYGLAGLLASSLAALALACSDSAGPKASSSSTSSSGGADAGDDAGEAFNAGEELKIPVSDGQRVYVKLTSPPAIVTPAGDAKLDKTWDLAFEGVDVFTNSGPSGSGAAQAFGPLEPIVFLEDVAPDPPFLTGDKSGGAFIRWYFYEGPPNHALYSRFHVFGVKDGAKLYRVQVLNYYGKRDGAPVAALYKIRYAEVGQPAKEAVDLDGTAGGTAGAGDPASACIDLGTGVVAMLTSAEARTSSAWHICFRRQDISVNGELGGPRNVGAIDFDADKSAAEKFVDIVNKTPESELARFDAINAQSFDGQTLRGDRIVSAFSGLWTERGISPLTPTKSAWLVVGADGKKRYLLGFSRFDGATATVPGTVVMRVKAVK
jgi:hypothetical protein